MTEDNPIEDLQNRVVGKRYYDEANDESFTVVGVSSIGNVGALTLHQYDDGIAWDEAATPDMFGSEDTDRFGLEQGGIDSERYTPLGSGPTIRESQLLCPGGFHEWTPRPDKVWTEGVPKEALIDTYQNFARCGRCGISGAVAMEFMGHETPWFCARCEEVHPGEELSYWVDDWKDLPVCTECQEELD